MVYYPKPGSPDAISQANGKVTSEIQSPLFNILTQIDMAAMNGLDLIAVSMAAALPDICGALISQNGQAHKTKYIAWCKENLVTGFDYLTPEDLYQMRCGVLHQGRLTGLKGKVKQVVFVPSGGSIFVDCIAGETYFYSARTFCININRAVVRWVEINHKNEIFQTNAKSLMQYRSGHRDMQGRVTIS